MEIEILNRMKSLVALSVLVILLLSTVYAVGSSPQHSNEYNGTYVQYWTYGHNISNFSAKINGVNELVFRSINESQAITMIGMNSSIVAYDTFMTPISFRGLGTLSFLLARGLEIENDSMFGANEITISNDFFRGMIVTDGTITQQGGWIQINDTVPFFALYITLPFSYINVMVNNYVMSGNDYLGNYSEYEEEGGNVLNYSLLSENSSVTVFRSLSFNSSGGIMEDNVLAQPILQLHDAQSPSIYGYTGSGTYNISLSEGYTLAESSRSNVTIPSIPNMILSNMTFINFQSETFLIYLDGRNIGLVHVFGSSITEGGSQLLISPYSTFSINFKPVQLSSTGLMANGSNNGTVSAEILLDQSPSFFSYSYNVSIRSVVFKNGTFSADVYQMGNSTYLIVLPRGFRVLNVTVNGHAFHSGVMNNGYRTVNNTNGSAILLAINQTGNISIALSVITINEFHRIISLFGLFLIVSAALIIAAISLIFYARRKSLKIYEKDN